VLCANVAECDIDRVTASDTNSAVDDPTQVANSFFITAPSTSTSSSRLTTLTTTKNLLVTNGPNEYKQWMLSFRQLRASMLHGVDNAERVTAEKTVEGVSAFAAADATKEAEKVKQLSENENVEKTKLTSVRLNHSAKGRVLHYLWRS